MKLIKFVAFIFLCISLLFGCQYFSESNPDLQNSIIEEETLTEYRDITLADFAPMGSQYSEPNNWDLNDLKIIPYSLSAAYEYFMQALDQVVHGNANIVPKSVEVDFKLHVKNEGITIDPVNGTTQLFDFEIEHLDLVVYGKLNSLSRLLLRNNDISPEPYKFAADSNVGTSFFMQGTSESKVAKMLLSIYLNLSIKNSDLGSNGTVSGSLSASFGSNQIYDYSSNKIGSFPYIVKLEIRPFKNVPINNFNEAFEILQNINNSQTPTSDWKQVCDLIWGNHNEDYYLRVTRIIGKADGTEDLSKLLIIKDLDIMSFINNSIT